MRRPVLLRQKRALVAEAGGRVLLIVEATERNSVFQLASVGFIEGLSGYRDFRRREVRKPDAHPLRTWQDALGSGRVCKRAGVALRRDHHPSSLRQHLLVAFAWRKSPEMKSREPLLSTSAKRFGKLGLPS